MKKILKKTIVTGIIALIFGIGYYPVFGVAGPNDEYGIRFRFPFDHGALDINECNTNSGNCTDLGNQIEITDNVSIINRLLKVFGLNSDIINQDEHKFINYAKAILNIALGLLSLIALVMTIYTFYMMFFTENESGIKKAKGNMIGIFIALAIIGLAWLIVSFIFRWYQNHWQTALI